MSFLVPLYLAGLAALSLPLVFHLIRRAPRGEMPFSATMFLSPSPPRLTRRSRLDNLLLLLLRALALALVALAFARPLLRELASPALMEAPRHRVALLLDTSASMQRSDLWDQALDKVDQLVARRGAHDAIAVYTFDETVRPIATFEDLSQLDPARRRGEIAARLRQIEPTWNATHLGRALSEVATSMSGVGTAEEPEPSAAGGRVVLISDMQTGGRLDTLAETSWPAGIELELVAVQPGGTTNAGIARLADGVSEEDPEGSTSSLRVRVTNASNSRGDEFRLQWFGDEEPLEGPIDVYVPPGESRVVQVGGAPADAATPRLVLQGDDHPFDNTLQVVPVRQQPLELVYLGSDEPGDAQGLRFYFESALDASARSQAEVAFRLPADGPVLEGTSQPQLVVVTTTPTPDQQQELRSFLEQGGKVLMALTSTDDESALQTLTGIDELTLAEAEVAGYAMLGKVALDHPLFAAMAGPQFNDFTQIRFWRYRKIDPTLLGEGEVIAHFEKGDPAILQRGVGKGNLLVFTTGWHPSDSQMARSWKFLLMISALIEPDVAASRFAHDYVVNQRLVWPGGIEWAENPHVTLPNGSEVPVDDPTAPFTRTDQPGRYQISTSEGPAEFVVHLDPIESETAPLAAEAFEQLGCTLAGQYDAQAQAAALQQLRDVELESRQRIWKWLIAAALGVLIAETLLAGWLSRTPSGQLTPAVTA